VVGGGGSNLFNDDSILRLPPQGIAAVLGLIASLSCQEGTPVGRGAGKQSPPDRRGAD